MPNLSPVSDSQMIDSFNRLVDGITFEFPDRAKDNLQRLAANRLPNDLLRSLVIQLTENLATVSDPDMALNNLERFFLASRSPLGLAALFARDPSAVPVLLKIFSSSQYLADQLIRDPSSYDALRLASGQPVSRELLLDELGNALAVLEVNDDAPAMTAIRRFKHRETLRIAFGDIIGQQDLKTVTTQISYLADAICQEALTFAHRKTVAKHGEPMGTEGKPSVLTVVAMGKLGGSELNYSSDIDLVFFYDSDGKTAAGEGQRSIENHDYFARVIRHFVKLLTENTALGVAYRVDLRLRPGGGKAPLSSSFSNAMNYYDLRGRTWERQAFVKARVIAGNKPFGQRILDRLNKWVYAKRLSVSQINGIRALKRQIERRVLQEGDDATNVKTGHGGIRDVEFTIQFLQLLHGAEDESVRTGNTLEAIDLLYAAACINSQEQRLLSDGYRWLREVEHRLQIMFDLQTHCLPESKPERIKLAKRMHGSNLNTDNPEQALQQFEAKLAAITAHNRAILDHLLHDAFDDQGSENNEAIGQEADLVLDYHLDEQTIQSVLNDYGFENSLAAHRNLLKLAEERNRFLSSRRCRHFLASIIKPLLQKISETPHPDQTLVNLTRVSDSLGGKAAIWELFRVHPPTLQLYVKLCAACDYLCAMLIRNPGMIDELTDALILQQLPSLDILHNQLRNLLENAEDSDPIIHSFRDAQHLRVGVRDIVGQDEIASTHRALSDIAEVCLGEIITFETRKLTEKLGSPLDGDGQAVPISVIAMGKLGGREPNYHSDLDIVFFYDGDGKSQTDGGRQSTNHQDFFSRLAANVTRRIAQHGPYGKLYDIDLRLRPTGKSGSAAVSSREFLRYFAEGAAQLWEHLALCKARVLFRNTPSTGMSRDFLAQVLTTREWVPDDADNILAMRMRMQEGAKQTNIKRGIGGTTDVAFTIQMLQLRHAKAHPTVLQPNTVNAASELNRLGLLSIDDYEFFKKSYRMLRWVEARIRLMDIPLHRHDLPTDPIALSSLTYLLGYDKPERLLTEVQRLREGNRHRMLKLFQVHGTAGTSGGS